MVRLLDWRRGHREGARRGGMLALVVLGIILGRGMPAGAEDPSPTAPVRAVASDHYVADFVRREQIKAQTRMLEQETELLHKLGQPGAAVGVLARQLHPADAALREALQRVVQEGTHPILEDLEAARQRLAQQTEKLQADWQAVRRSLAQGRTLLAAVQSDRQMAGHLASLLSFDKRWFWLFGVVSIATLLGVVLHDRRRELRRYFYGGRARTLGLTKILAATLLLLALATVVTFLCGQQIESLWTRGKPAASAPPGTLVGAADKPAAAGNDLSAELAALETTRAQWETRYKQAEGEWLRGMPPGGPDALVVSWQEFRRLVRAVVAEQAVLEALPAAVEADVAELGKLRDDWTANHEAIARYHFLRNLIRGSLGCALLGLAAVGGVLFWRGQRQRAAATAATCPLCLGKNSLRPDGHDPHAADDAAHMVRCRNVIRDYPREECDYRFASGYQPMTKLCFPTLGVPQAGKTHWLAMLYWELNRGNYPKAVQFEKIKSQTSEDFELLVEEILSSRIGTAATQRDRIPSPVVFNLRDRDLWGRANLLVNIFDYSGEVTLDMGTDDYRRRRALEADGYFFFLDPTYPSAPQAKALADFREDLRLIKGIKAGRKVRVPIALCVTKIDLLSARFIHTGGGDALERFYRELGAIDPTGDSYTPRVIEARSRLVSRLRETIWPGWDIEHQVRDLFGGRYRFFPLTPVGLDGRGETDLSLRTISPFGLIEPLMWLLQMTGYKILS